MAKLAVYKNRQHLFNYYLEDDEVVVGRSKDVQVLLDSEAVSRRHLRFRRHGATYTVEDLSNKNGMFVNGQFTNMHVLKDGDKIEVPQHLLVFTRSEGEAEEARLPRHHSQMHKLSSTQMEKLLDTRAVTRTAPTKTVNVEATARMSPADLEKLLKANQVRFSAHLAWVDGDEKKTIVLRDQAVDIGWSERCQVVLPGPSVLSQVAARILPRQEGGFVLEALSRWPWVKVGGERVLQLLVLKDGDIIEIGSAKVRFHADLMA